MEGGQSFAAKIVQKKVRFFQKYNLEKEIMPSEACSGEPPQGGSLIEQETFLFYFFYLNIVCVFVCVCAEQAWANTCGRAEARTALQLVCSKVRAESSHSRTNILDC